MKINIKEKGKKTEKNPNAFPFDLFTFALNKIALIFY